MKYLQQLRARRPTRAFFTSFVALSLQLAPVHSARATTTTPPLTAATNALNTGHADEAIALLGHLSAAAPGSGLPHLLLCRVYLSEVVVDDAVAQCQMAVASLPRDSAAQDWLGRAYGLKASHANSVNAFTLARKVRDAFVSAVQLDPRNGAAVDDLSEYYVGAPFVVGGGLDKALALATEVQNELPQQAHRIRALAAEKDKDYGTAEREFRAAVEVAHLADAWADLAAFYARRGDGNRTISTVQSCIAADSRHDATLVDAASILTDAHREPDLAERLLREYLASPDQTDAAPAFRVRVMLGHLLEARGDKPAAKIEFDEALTLASGYVPAKLALQQL